MTLDTFFILVVPTYLVLVAYGQVGSRRRGLDARARAVAGALRVALPPLAIFGALAWTGMAALLVSFGILAGAMLVAGAIVAALVEAIAPRVGA